MPEFSAPAPGRLLDVLKTRFPDWKTGTLRDRLRHGLVRLNGEAALSGATPVAAGDRVEVAGRPVRPDARFPVRLGEPPLPILYADDVLLAVDKPSGLLSVASERERDVTVVHLMREWLAGIGRNGTAGTVHAAHRLDRDASGVLLLVRTLEAKRRLAAAWSGFEKTYVALTDGIPAEAEGSIELPLWEDRGLFVRGARPGGGEAALTRYRRVKTRGGRALVEVELGTGRKHQIRVHLAHIGCPIVGDARYGVSKASRLALHAHRLRITHPGDGRPVTIVSPVPAFFRRELARGRRKETGDGGEIPAPDSRR